MNRRDALIPAQQVREPSGDSHGSHRVGCMVFGHDYGFSADGPTMRWECRRGCGDGGSKTYRSAADAARYAGAFDRRDAADVGRRAPLIGLLPLRLWRHFQDRKRGGSS